MYIDKRTLNPFFKKTNSTPQDLLDWVEMLMKECSNDCAPCVTNKNSYMGYYTVYSAQILNPIYPEVMLNLSKSYIKLDYEGIYGLWGGYVSGDKQPLLDAIKEFKEKYNL